MMTQEALSDKLASRWVEFGRLLRRNGVQVTPQQMRDNLRGLSLLDLGDKQTVYYASRALLCARHTDFPAFDITFRQFWGRTRQIIIPSDTGSLSEHEQSSPNREIALNDSSETEQDGPSLIEKSTISDDLEEDPEWDEKASAQEELKQALLYSLQERLRKLDFARFTEEELLQAKLIMASWQWEPGERRTRRLRARKHGHKLDTVRTTRRAMKTEGVPYKLEWRGPRTKPRPLVVLCDISGSMAPYTRIMLYFLHTLRRRVLQAEVFLFGTRLSRITKLLKTREVDDALAEIGQTVQDWSGGTRIGEAIRTFNTVWARRTLGQGAVVCIISDGWDRGDPALLASEVAHLQRTAFRLIWLNPLLGIQGYRPLTRGMAAALPYVDDFLAIHNLDSLHELASLLTSLQLNVRPTRKQTVLLHPPTLEGSTTLGPHFTVKTS